MPQLASILLLVISAISLIFPKITLADSIVINEFLAHPSSGNQEWVEFYNSSGTDISSYFLDDDTDFSSDSGSSGKKSLSGYNGSNSTYPYLEFNSFLNNSGDYVVLFDSSGTLIDKYQYIDDPGIDATFGRAPDGTGAFFKLDSSSKGAQNGTPIPQSTPQTESDELADVQVSASKSPSPTLKASPIQAKSPTPSPKKSTAILGEKEEATPQATPSPKPESPTPVPKAESSNRTKIASYLVGSGLIVIGLAAGLFLWFKKRLKTDEKPQ